MIEYFKFTESELQKHLLNILKEHGAVWKDKAGNIHFMRGYSPMPCILTHLDTVFPQPPKVVHTAGGVFRSRSPNVGLGGDDRSGVYAAVRIIRETSRPLYALFTTGEERGGGGARRAEFETRIQYIIALDRRGFNDAVFYHLGTAEFKKAVLDSLPQHKEQPGTWSDLTILAERIKRCGVNLSIGYYNNHRPDEYVVKSHNEFAISSAKTLMKKLGRKVFPYEKPSLPYDELDELEGEEMRRDWDYAKLFKKANEMAVQNPPETKSEDVTVINRPPKAKEIPTEQICGKGNIIVVLGKRGSGKTALAHRIIEDAHKKHLFRNHYLVGIPDASVVPGWLHIVREPESCENDSVLLIDEAALKYSARRWQSKGSLMLAKLIEISRHKSLCLIFICLNSAALDVALLRDIDTLFLKEPSMLQIKMERPQVQKVFVEAERLLNATPEDERKSCAVMFTKDDYGALVKYKLPTYWSEELSKAYAGAILDETQIVAVGGTDAIPVRRTIAVAGSGREPCEGCTFYDETCCLAMQQEYPFKCALFAERKGMLL